MNKNLSLRRSELKKLTGFVAEEELKRLSFILSQLQKLLGPGNGEVMEIGCGNGKVSAGIASLGYQTVGVDIDEESIRVARESFRFPNLEFFCSAAEDLTDDNKVYDAIVCTEVLEHLENPTVVLSYAYERLKPGGFFISTVPNGFGPRELFMTKPIQYIEKTELSTGLSKLKRALGYGHGTVQSSNPDLEHIQFFTKRLVLKMHRDFGFELISFKNGDFINNVFPWSLITRRLIFFQKIDCFLADILPHFLASGFYMSFRKK